MGYNIRLIVIQLNDFRHKIVFLIVFRDLGQMFGRIVDDNNKSHIQLNHMFLFNHRVYATSSVSIV
ncbi:hypothetical protein VIAG107301_13630 [Vibrio agarivorans]